MAAGDLKLMTQGKQQGMADDDGSQRKKEGEAASEPSLRML
jgi:hypothetical protein